jgi:cysteine-rich repeat protein
MTPRAVLPSTLRSAFFGALLLSAAVAGTPDRAEAVPCRDWFVTVRLTDAEVVPLAVQCLLDYSGSGGLFTGGDKGAVSCEGRVDGALFSAGHSLHSQTVRLSLIHLEGIPVPGPIARCRFRQFSTEELSADDIAVVVEGAWNDPSVEIVAVAKLRFAEAGEILECGDRCGDGYLDERFEQCDDGNTQNGDDCPSHCRPPLCGNGVNDSQYEECDDGNLNDWDSCTGACQSARCGDGIVRAGYEACDDGNASETDGCTTSCTTTCGDGVVQEEFAEECDDANTGDGDGCVGRCLLARCGDRHIRFGVEECDDGNISNADGCVDCARAYCGDGVVLHLVEQCDDANDTDGDECPNDCGVSQACGDANGDGSISASDATRALQSAVGLDVECARWAADVDSSATLQVSDSLRILRYAVDQPILLSCPVPSELRLRLSAPTDLAALVTDIDLSKASAELGGEGGAVQCESLLPDASMAFELVASDTLRVTANIPGELAGRKSFARCDLVPSGPLDASDFPTSIVSSTTSNGIPAAGVKVKAVPY